MGSLKHWQDKIKEKRSSTSFKEYIKYTAVWKPYIFHKVDGRISRYADNIRKPHLVESKKFLEYRNTPQCLEYDFSMNFFCNFKKLFEITPMPYIFNFYDNNENADFSDNNFGVKNSYLSNTVWLDAENVCYSCFSYSNIKNVYNGFFITNGAENIYFSSAVWKNSFKVFYSKYITNSNNIWFPSNLIWCSECIFCNNLENKKYCIENQEYSKEEYFHKKNTILEEKRKFLNYYNSVNKRALNYASKNCSWNALYFCENVEQSYFFVRLKNGRNVMIWDGLNWCENFVDCFDVWVNSQDLYWCVWAWDALSNAYISWEVGNGSNIFYSYMLDSCSYCFGCVWLQNKSYCILNKQYTKEEWEILAEKIFSQMEQDGILWDFFPWDLNPFYFNDTMAWLLWDFTKEEIEKEGYMWRGEEIKVDIPEWADIISTKDLSDYQWYDENGEWKIDKEVLKKVIKDEKGNYYRVVKVEYDFLVKHDLPLPEIHWMDRMKLNFGL